MIAFRMGQSISFQRSFAMPPNVHLAATGCSGNPGKLFPRSALGARPAILVRAPSCIHGGTNGERTLNRAGMSIRRQWAALVTHPTNHDFMAFFHLSERTPNRYRRPMDRMPVPGDLSSSTVKGWGRRLTLGGGEGMT